MNNSGFGSYSNNSQSLNTYSIGQSQSLNFPIKWEDNSNSLTSSISIVANVSYYAVDTNGNTYLAGSRIHSSTYAVNINRIFTPTISSPTILSCCSNPVTFSASNFGTANVFNWSISGGSFTGSGSSITVTPSAGNGSVFASCTVSRSAGLSTYNRSNSITVNRTARTATFSALYPEHPYNSQPLEYMCKGTGRQLNMPAQCGATNINWVATGCTITGQNTLTPRITPTTAATGSNINVYAVVTFTGGCTATTPTQSFRVFDGTVAPTPTGYVRATANNGNICTTELFNLSFVSTNGFNNGITTVSPDFMFGPGDAFHYRPNRTKTVSVCNVNICTGVKTCRSYTVYPPAPCYTDRNRRMADDSQIALSEYSTTKLVIAPNPTTGIIQANLPETASGTYQVFNQNASLVLEASFDNQSSLEIDLSSFNSGVYILKVTTENNSYNEKIILSK